MDQKFEKRSKTSKIPIAAQNILGPNTIVTILLFANYAMQSEYRNVKLRIIFYTQRIDKSFSASWIQKNYDVINVRFKINGLGYPNKFGARKNNLKIKQKLEARF